MLSSRIATGVVGASLLLWIVSVDGWPLRLAVMLLSGLGLWELHQIVSRQNMGFDLLITGILTVVFVGYPGILSTHPRPILALLVLYLLARSVLDYHRFSLISMALTVFAAFYLPFLFSFVILIRQLPNGLAWLIISFAITWGYDTAAFVAGSTWGRHRLCPDLSPSKSIEGMIGGLAVSTLASALIGYAFGFNAFVVGLIGLLGGCMAQIGDLAESAIKRQFKTKDSGHILPGHGGILDRFDSYLAVIPFLYIILTVGN